MRGRALSLIVSMGFACAGCGARSGLEAGLEVGDAGATAPDADVGREEFPRCLEGSSPGWATVHGYALELDESCKPLFPGVTSDVCWLDHADHCVKNDLLGAYRLELPNDEVVLRITREGSLPRLLPLHPYGCDFGSNVFLGPTRSFVAKVLAPVGGLDEGRSILLVYAERKAPGVPGVSPCSAGTSGFVVTSNRGVVHYMDAAGTAIDPALHATSPSGLAMIVADAGAPVSIVAAKAGAGNNCKMSKGFGFRRGDVHDLSRFQTDAPALAGHLTYALYTQCTGPGP